VVATGSAPSPLPGTRSEKEVVVTAGVVGADPGGDPLSVALSENRAYKS
jgi:hypothetical protein